MSPDITPMLIIAASLLGVFAVLLYGLLAIHVARVLLADLKPEMLFVPDQWSRVSQRGDVDE